MPLLLRHKLLIGGATVALAATGGAAYAATQSDATGQQAFVGDVAKRLHVSPAQLTAAVKAALIDRLNAEVKAGRLSQAEANKIEQAIKQNAKLPFFFAPGAHRFLGVHAKGLGVFHAAATYLGLTNPQLLSDLRSGQSLAQIAKAHGKSVSGLEQAILTAEKTRLNRAVSDGVITKAQEEQLLARLSAKVSRLVNRAGIGFRVGPPGMAKSGAVPVPPGAVPAPPNGTIAPGVGPRAGSFTPPPSGWAPQPPTA